MSTLGDVAQVTHVRLLQALARAVGDPDSEFPVQVAVGVQTGIDSPLPRTPAIFEKKVRWALPSEEDQEWDGERWRTTTSRPRTAPR